MLKSLKTTTALVASLNLIVPFPALAQATDAQNRAIEECSADITSEACLTATQDAVNEGADPAQLQADIQAEADASASADAATPAEPAEPAEPAAPADAGTVTESAEPADPATPAEPAVSAEGTAAAETEMNTDTTVEAEAGTDMEAEANAEADTAAEAEAEMTTEADTSTEADTATEAASDTQASTDDTMPSTDELEQQLGEAAAESDAAMETTEADANAEAEATADTQETVTTIDQDTTAETSTVPADEQTDTATADATANTEANAEAPTEAEQAAIEGTAPVAAAAAADDAEAVESETTTVTETRSSSEDFEGDINAQASGSAQTQASNNDDNDDEDGISGLTDLEKALVLGAGALGVGMLLRGNQQVVASSNDRVVVSGSDGGYQLIKDDNSLLLQPGAQVQNETFQDGSSRSTVTYEDGTRIVTIRDDQLRVVRRVRISPDGQQVVLIDDLNNNIQPVNVQQLQQTTQQSQVVNLSDEAALRQALAVDRSFDRAYSLSQVRNIAEVRQQVPAIDLEAITFETASAAIRPEQADELRGLGQYIRDEIQSNPRVIFLVEGHTDTVGNAAYNLALSDRRAESVALALTEYFDVPASNLIVQGYGERFLKVEQEGDVRANRRATVRNVTPLLQVAAAN